MTFYNVLAGVLFLGAFQQFLQGLANADMDNLVMSMALLFVVFNDAIYTSHMIEGEKRAEYRLPLMLIDLLNFVLLAWALVELNPNSNIFNVNMNKQGSLLSAGFLGEGTFWLIISCSWLCGMCWAWQAGIYDEQYPRNLLWAAFAVFVLFFSSFAMSFTAWQVPKVTLSVFALVYFLSYVGLVRLRLHPRTQPLAQERPEREPSNR